jgi:hypothetical protein
MIRLRLLFAIAAITSVFVLLTVSLWRVTRPASRSGDLHTPTSRKEESPKAVAGSQTVEPKMLAEANSPRQERVGSGSPQGSEAAPATKWVVGDTYNLLKSREELSEGTLRLRRLTGSELDKSLAAVSRNIAALGAILDATPMPIAPLNVDPPSSRPDGSPYPPQLVFAGMAPSAIKDPEHRKAYEEAIRKRNADSAVRIWLIQAQASYNLLFHYIDTTLDRLVERQAISEEMRSATLAAIRRQRDNRRSQK